MVFPPENKNPEELFKRHHALPIASRQQDSSGDSIQKDLLGVPF
jgi:hypothetical protein